MLDVVLDMVYISEGKNQQFAWLGRPNNYSIVMLFILYLLMHLCFTQDTEVASSGLCKGFTKLTIPQHYLLTHTYIHAIFPFFRSYNIINENWGTELRYWRSRSQTASHNHWHSWVLWQSEWRRQVRVLLLRTQRNKILSYLVCSHPF